MDGAKDMEQETAEISYQAMLELMRLPVDSKRRLAVMLASGKLGDQADSSHKVIGRLIDQICELSLSIKRMRAVAQCFANDYVDVSGSTCAQAVAYDEESYEHLFNAFFGMIADIDAEAEDLHEKADQLFKETMAKI